MTIYHNPVLLEASIKGLNIKPNGIYVDVTFGGGGHSRSILDQLGETGRLVAFDQDQDALVNDIDDPRFVLVSANFRNLTAHLRLLNISKIDGLLADFGVSSHQFDQAERGFSTRYDAPLDMRMNQLMEYNAKDIIAKFSVEDLASLFRKYADLPNAYSLAKAIGTARNANSIETTFQLIQSLESGIYTPKRNQQLAQVFQAIRIEVNKELEVIESLLMQLGGLMDPGARAVFISYHSLEDRLVKNFIRSSRFEGETEKDHFGNPNVNFKKVGRVQTPKDDELILNTRSRSAKLRVAQRIKNKYRSI
jgi:16S rRNA (cytosine1402-N4)-methyltransferase